MAYSTIQKVRERAGIQNKANRIQMVSTGSSWIWKVDCEDPFKIVPNNNDGATVATIADVTVEMCGVGVSVTAVNELTGEVTLGSGSSSGATVVATYASSPISNDRLVDYLNEAYSTVNAYISKQYTLPLSSVPSYLIDLESKLAAGNILKSSYGTSALDLAEDGYRLQQDALADLLKLSEGEIDLVDDTGTVLSKKEMEGGGETNVSEGEDRTQGWLFIPEEEEFDVHDPDDYRP